MIHKIVHYKVKQDEVDVIAKATQNFVEAVRTNEPQTNYQAYQRLDDSTRFIHVMSFQNQEAEGHHKDADYTQAFVDVLSPRCEEEPEFTDLSQIAVTLGEGTVDWAN